MPSNTIHCAPISCCFASSMASMPARSKSPALTSVGRQMRVHEEQLLGRQGRQAPIERGAVGDELAWALLERDEYPGRSLPIHAIDQALQREHGLACARASDDQAGAVARQSALAQFIESLDAREQFRQRQSRFSWGTDGGLAFERISVGRKRRMTRAPTVTLSIRIPNHLGAVCLLAHRAEDARPACGWPWAAGRCVATHAASGC